MEKNPWLLDDEPAVEDGPDYVALVIEWDNIADELEGQTTSPTEASPAATTPVRAHRGKLASIAGVVGALALVAWGIHRLRA